MVITRREIAELIFPYAVSIFNCEDGKKAIVATELQGDCLAISVDNLSKEIIWQNMGGTMNVCQLNDQGDFLAIQQFYKGFNSKTACIVKVQKRNGSWKTEKYIDLPFVHRFCLVDIGPEKFIIASTLCDDKDYKDDWAKPGRVYMGKVPDDDSLRGELHPIINGITKNHGMHKGFHQGRAVIFVTGQEGVYEIFVPDRSDESWDIKHIMENEVSDLTVFDIDGDGVEEIITIEKFHGNKMVIYKPYENEWKEIYSYPINFGHVIYGGIILGKPSLIVGYRGANGALLMMRVREKREEDLIMDITVIDEHEAPTNIDVYEDNDVCKIFSCSGGKNRVVLYELTDK